MPRTPSTPPSRRTALVLWRLVAGTAAVVGSSCGSPGQGETIHSTSGEVKGTTSPAAEDLEAFVNAAFGVSESELRTEVDKHRIELAIECAGDRGANLTDVQLESLRRLPAPPPNFGGEVAYLIASRLAPQAEPTDTPSDEVVTECLVAIAEGFEDPFEAYDDWVSEMSERLSSQVLTDPRYVDAAAESADCIQDLGFASGDPTEVANRIAAEADSAISNFELGAVSRAALDTRLADLQQQEDAIAPDMSACVEIRLAAEREVFSELQASLVSEDSERLQEVRTQLDQRLRQIRLGSESD